MEVAGSNLVPQSSLPQACFLLDTPLYLLQQSWLCSEGGCWLRPALHEVTSLGLLSLLSLSLACTHWPGSDPLKFAASCLILQRLLAQACSRVSCWFGPTLVDVPGLGLGPVPQRSLALTCYSKSHWLGLTLVEVFGLSLLPKDSVSQACSCVGHWLVPDSTEFVELGLLLWRLQAWAWSCRGSRLRLVSWSLLTWPTLEEFAHSGLFPQMSLTGACSQRGCWPVSDLTEFSLSALFLQRSLTWAHLLFFNKRPV